MHFVSCPDHGMALIGLNIVTGPMPQSSKCISLKMVRYKSIKHDFSIVQTSQLVSIGMEGSGLDQVGHLSGQPTLVERDDNQDDRGSPSSSNTKTLSPNNHPLGTNGHQSLRSTRPHCPMSLPFTKPSCTLGSSFLRERGDVMEPVYWSQTHLHLLTFHLHVLSFLCT